MMCNNCPVESAAHLLFLCPYATTVWFDTGIRGDSILTNNQMSTSAIWTNFVNTAKTKGVNVKKHMGKVLCTVWELWKQRNQVLFGGQKLPPKHLADRIDQEYKLWEKYI